jgi:hypothetical protein
MLHEIMYERPMLCSNQARPRRYVARISEREAFAYNDGSSSLAGKASGVGTPSTMELNNPRHSTNCSVIREGGYVFSKYAVSEFVMPR